MGDGGRNNVCVWETVEGGGGDTHVLYNNFQRKWVEGVDEKVTNEGRDL